ncbi:MAG: hypothetical protein ACREC5_04580 [Thermoplasmata archaeon]
MLRPREGKQAVLYEVLSRDTSEMGTAARRKRGMGTATQSPNSSSVPGAGAPRRRPRSRPRGGPA